MPQMFMLFKLFLPKKTLFHFDHNKVKPEQSGNQMADTAFKILLKSSKTPIYQYCKMLSSLLDVHNSPQHPLSPHVQSIPENKNKCNIYCICRQIGLNDSFILRLLVS